jgi:hypothetical protein
MERVSWVLVVFEFESSRFLQGKKVECSRKQVVRINTMELEQ